MDVDYPCHLFNKLPEYEDFRLDILIVICENIKHVSEEALHVDVGVLPQTESYEGCYVLEPFSAFDVSLANA